MVFGVDSSCNRNVTLIGDQYTHLYASLRHGKQHETQLPRIRNHSPSSKPVAIYGVLSLGMLLNDHCYRNK